MSLEIAWQQNILVTDSNLLKSVGFGSQAFVCEFSRQNICSVSCLALQCRVCERMSCELSVIWDNLIFSILTFMCKALSGRCLYLQCFLGFTGFSGCVPCRAVVKFSNPGSVGTSVTWHDVVKFLNWDVISGDVQPVLCRETPWSTLKKA